jgi:hypothetical protein
MHITNQGRTMKTKAKKTTPTRESYSELETAYAHFNKELFQGKLPPCLMTLVRGKRFKGYFWGDKFGHLHRDAVWTDEIAMNPDLFKFRTVDETLSTVAHEMVHLWQHRFGKSSRNGYHNKEWARKMEAIGLMPSTTGEPGGNKTGQSVTHYIIKGAAFDLSCRRLLKTGFRITWGSKPTHAPTAAGSKGEGEEGEEGRSGKRVKYCCPMCDNAVWGKGEMNIMCGDCEEQMQGE